MNKPMPGWAALLLGALLLGVPGGGWAGEAKLLQLIGYLRDNGSLTQAQYELLTEAARTPDEAAPPPSDPPPTAKPGFSEHSAASQTPAITTHQAEAAPSKNSRETTPKGGRSDVKGVEIKTKGGIKVTSGDGDFQAKLGGRIMADAVFANDDQTDLLDGTEFRRVRLHLKGRLYDDWTFKSQIEFSDNEVDLKDMWLGYDGWERFGLQMGQFKTPFSLEESTSSKYITFMERAMPNELAPGYGIGVNLSSHGDNWFWGGALFGEDADSGDDRNEAWGVSSRLAWAPVLAEGRVLHLGLGLAWLDNDDGEVSFGPHPDAHMIPALIEAEMMDVDHHSLLGLEAALVWGAFSLQGEAIWADVKRDLNPTASLNGAYGYASWFLTGESRLYEGDAGEFGRVKPERDFNLDQGGFGAWELAARYSLMDLNDVGVAGGEEDNITLGLNWYLNPQIRLMANYILVDTDEVAGNDDPDIFQMRMQVDF
ncbi:MAG: porin [Magnetococcales bacterium]|nr:porin [Magnetococcales bacterium]